MSYSVSPGATTCVTGVGVAATVGVGGMGVGVAAAVGVGGMGVAVGDGVGCCVGVTETVGTGVANRTAVDGVGVTPTDSTVVVGNALEDEPLEAVLVALRVSTVGLIIMTACDVGSATGLPASETPAAPWLLLNLIANIDATMSAARQRLPHSSKAYGVAVSDQADCLSPEVRARKMGHWSCRPLRQ